LWLAESVGISILNCIKALTSGDQYLGVVILAAVSPPWHMTCSNWRGTTEVGVCSGAGLIKSLCGRLPELSATLSAAGAGSAFLFWGSPCGLRQYTNFVSCICSIWQLHCAVLATEDVKLDLPHGWPALEHWCSSDISASIRQRLGRLTRCRQLVDIPSGGTCDVSWHRRTLLAAFHCFLRL
jgi:hypothetical protein